MNIKSNTCSTIEKIKLCYFKKKDSCYFRQEIIMGKGKNKAILVASGIFTNIPAYSSIVRYSQGYSGIRHIQAYLESCVTLSYSEAWHIQNQRHSQNPGIFITLAYLELWYIQNPGIFRNCGIFRALT